MGECEYCHEDPMEGHRPSCRVVKAQAMTTAAPPEKMSDAELAAKLLQWEGADEMLPLPKGLLREAARRLAPTMPTGGIHWALDQIRIMTQTVDARSRKQHPVVLRIAEVAKKALANSAPAPAAPRVGGDVREAVAALFARWSAGRDAKPGTVSYEFADAVIAILPAPPAASADERGSREPIKADNVNGCAICDCGSTEFRVGLQAAARSLSNHIRVLECVRCQHQMPVPFQQGGGYRKRAAQGVGEFAAELVKWCDEKEHRLNQLAGSRLYTETPELAARADQMREVAAHIRLSALRKAKSMKGDA